ncbi:bifunctional diguanylate cyclase/phosphodiesterase [Aromatoleum diolicum]|uniref:EAL domain-containing protein n=1 Tax=Aromatoleum diolicum TaxID=75796 RepID=A0ABX1QGF9_9RHOO|nr:EAL domain-containing protein [Aromatoleum diolicum]NMG76076.1 EAL domain-containing protein [Aromatoleum diolicum]
MAKIPVLHRLSFFFRWLPWMIGAGVLLVGLLVGLVLGWMDGERQLSDARSRTIAELATVQAQLDGVLKQTLSGSEGIVHLIQHQGDLSPELFDAMAEQIIANHPQIRNLGYAPNNVIARLYPLAGNEKALGLDFRTVPEQWKTIEQARQLGVPVLSGPVALVQGGQAVIVRAPVVLRPDGVSGRSGYWGTVSIVGDIERILEDGGVSGSTLLRIGLRGKDGRGEEGDVIGGDPAVFSADPVKTRLGVPGGHWVLAATPLSGWPSQSLTGSPYFLAALINAAVFALLAGLLVSRHRQLRERHELLLDESRQRQLAERAWRDSRSLLDAIVDNAPALIYAFDLKGLLLLCNRQFEAAVGHSRSEMVGRARDEFMPGDVARQHLENDRKVMEGGIARQFEENNIEPDGVHTYLTTKCLLLDDARNPIGVVGMSADITQRKQSEEALRLASTVVECTADGVVVTDHKGVIVATNPAFTEITGYSADEVKGKTPGILKSDRQEDEFYQHLWQSINVAGEWQGEIWNRRKNGEIYPEWLTISAVRDGNGNIRHFVGVFSDISTIKRTQEDLERLAHFDPLTSLPNRVLFHDRMQHALDRAVRYRRSIGVLLLDLDGFKTINDSLGHPVGDQLLQLVAGRLATCVRVEDTVARLGGDEFAVILSELGEGADAVEVIRRILSVIQVPFEMAGGNGMVTTSIGVAVFPDDGQTVTELIRNADAAMYEAKAAGRNTYRFYQRNMTEEAQKRLHIENALRRAVERGEFEVWFQPQFSLGTGAYLGAEALVRWRDPEHGLIPPGDFIPLAERSGLIIPLGEQVLDMVAAAARRWLDADLSIGRLGVNVAGPQIDRSDFVATLRRVISTWNVPPSVFEIEITETVIMENPDHGRRVLNEIQALGITTAIDDFGTGYSSLAYLKELPIGTIKLDRAFVKDLPEHPSDIAISRAVIALGHNLGFKVIAEGIETEAQRRFLHAEGCDEGQGYLFARPMPADVFENWLRARPPGEGAAPLSVGSDAIRD